MSQSERVALEAGFLLHHRPFRNTSQLVDCLTEHHGLVRLVARGSRRSRSGQRAVLQPFVPLRLSWVSRSDLGRLTGVEGVTHLFDFPQDRLLAGFYINELTLRLLHRGDPNQSVFSCYSDALLELASTRSAARALRLYETRLLRALGYGLNLQQDVTTGRDLEPDGRYAFDLDRGPRAADQTTGRLIFQGSHLISLRNEELADADSLRAAKRLLRRVLEQHLEGRPLNSWAVIEDVYR